MQVYLFYTKTYLFQKLAFYFERTLHQQPTDVPRWDVPTLLLATAHLPHFLLVGFAHLLNKVLAQFGPGNQTCPIVTALNKCYAGLILENH